MNCWSCQSAAGDGATCVACGMIQPVDPGADHFKVLGLPVGFVIDLTVAEEHFRQTSRAVHPDKFATADPQARRYATARTVQLNDAWRTLKDPVRRAEYLLSRSGFEVGAETGASRPATNGGAREKIAVPPALLSEILDLREELSTARAAGDAALIQKLAHDVRDRLRAVIDRVSSGFKRADGEKKGSSEELRALEIVTHDMIEIRYLRRFLDEVEAHEEESETSPGAPP